MKKTFNGTATVVWSVLFMFKYSLDRDSYTIKNAFLWGNCINHCKSTQTGDLSGRIVHALIALVESIPVIGQISSLCERWIILNHQGEKLVPKMPKAESVVRPFPQVTELRDYPGDLEEDKRPVLQLSEDQKTLTLTFTEKQEIKCEIRDQNLFNSGAAVLVNAANIPLQGGGGIDGEIHDRGGLSYVNEHGALRVQYNGRYPSGYAAMIGSGDLFRQGFERVIVVAGPSGTSSPEKEKQLYSCYLNSLILANDQGKGSIAFPAISTGIFDFPPDRAAKISQRAIYDFLTRVKDPTLKIISIHCYSAPNEKLPNKTLRAYMPG